VDSVLLLLSSPLSMSRLCPVASIAPVKHLHFVLALPYRFTVVASGAGYSVSVLGGAATFSGSVATAAGVSIPGTAGSFLRAVHGLP
jgi:hypothetical protein